LLLAGFITVDGANCLGLRLVEADVALQAATELYTKTIDPSRQACSIFGMAANEELPLLQGLAGDFMAAGEVLIA
jgi:hypothetical protein